jgi:hypothetical protein
VPEAFGFEYRAFLREFGETARRLVVQETREAAQGFHLADAVEPTAERATVTLLPTLEGDQAMQIPER